MASTKPDGTNPVRTCVGCRKIGPQRDLVRLVLVDGVPVVDGRRRLPGRGASIHPSDACVKAAVRQGAFGRAFRCRVVVASPLELSRTVTAALVFSRDGNGNPK
jgi:predicted RNA-binding protein YlxR (DUF448 family)